MHKSYGAVNAVSFFLFKAGSDILLQGCWKTMKDRGKALDRFHKFIKTQ